MAWGGALLRVEFGGDGEQVIAYVFVADALAVNKSVFFWIINSARRIVVIRRHLSSSNAEGGGYLLATTIFVAFAVDWTEIPGSIPNRMRGGAQWGGVAHGLDAPTWGEVTGVPFLQRSGLGFGVGVVFVPDPAGVTRLGAALIALSGTPFVRVSLNDADANVAAEGAGQWFSHCLIPRNASAANQTAAASIVMDSARTTDHTRMSAAIS